ncbi:MAG TPA: tripartite tricarboxylate transporter substrate binding protein [Xanthobacteraceae bacterium]
MATANAQDTVVPRGVIEITVLFPAGSSADVTARLLADGMSRRLGRSVIVINRPGGGGAVGYRYVAGQKPDGRSLVWNSNSISTTHHMGLLQLDYESFAPVAQVLVETPVVAVRGDAKAQTLAALIAESKARPEGITVGNSGVGSHTHITSVALFRAAGARVVDVPFGAAEVITSLLGGQVDAVVQLPAALAEHVKGGQARLLAAMSATRDPAFPDVPTAVELGWNVSLEAWRGIAAPKGTPQDILAAYEAAIKGTIESGEFTQGCLRLGARPAFLPADQFGTLIAKQDAELARLMDVIGLKK